MSPTLRAFNFDILYASTRKWHSDACAALESSVWFLGSWTRITGDTGYILLTGFIKALQARHCPRMLLLEDWIPLDDILNIYPHPLPVQTQ